MTGMSEKKPLPSWFVGLVAERRKLERAVALRLSDGRVYTGQQALDNKLVDAIGGEDVAIAWLENSRGVAKKLRVRTWTVRRDVDRGGFWRVAAGWIGGQLGLDAWAPPAAINAAVSQRLELDGLLSVWQASVD